MLFLSISAWCDPGIAPGVKGRKRVFGDDTRTRIQFADVASLVARVPDVTLPIDGRVVKHEQMSRQFIFGNDDPRRLAAGTRKDAKRRVLRLRTADTR